MTHFCGGATDDDVCGDCGSNSLPAMYLCSACADEHDRRRETDGVSRLPISESLLKRMRVRWVIGAGHAGFGQVIAVYSNGTCDVESDRGPIFRGWPLKNLQGDV